MATSQLDLIMNQVQRLPSVVADPDIQRELQKYKNNLPGSEKQVDENHFRQLADQWRQETEHISSLKQACLHPAYQRIIGMGPAVIPYLLRELEQAPDHWFWALNAITEEDPAQSKDSFEGARQAWLAWGKEKGYL